MADEFPHAFVSFLLPPSFIKFDYMMADEFPHAFVPVGMYGSPPIPQRSLSRAIRTYLK